MNYLCPSDLDMSDALADFNDMPTAEQMLAMRETGNVAGSFSAGAGIIPGIDIASDVPSASDYAPPPSPQIDTFIPGMDVGGQSPVITALKKPLISTPPKIFGPPDSLAPKVPSSGPSLVSQSFGAAAQAGTPLLAYQLALAQAKAQRPVKQAPASFFFAPGQSIPSWLGPVALGLGVLAIVAVVASGKRGR